jgi:hypothetical protein
LQSTAARNNDVFKTWGTEYFRGIGHGFEAASSINPIYMELGFIAAGGVGHRLWPEWASYGWLPAAGGWAGFQGYQNYDIKQFRQSTTTFGGRLSILAKRLNLNSANGAQ